jgi:anthranilate/para-aminobenzoate synthase component I
VEQYWYQVQPFEWRGDAAELIAALAHAHKDVMALHTASDPQGLCVIGVDAFWRTIGAAVPNPGLPSFERCRIEAGPLNDCVGWMGYVSYDIGRLLEPVGEAAADDTHWPVSYWTLFFTYFVRKGGVWYVASMGKPASVVEARPMQRGTLEVVEQTPRAQYEQRVQRVKDYIAAGDVYQVNLAQRWVLKGVPQPGDVYRRLCQRSPAPYAA